LGESCVYDEAPSVDYLVESAKVFAEFSKAFADCSLGDWVEVIPDFHHVPKRLEQLDEVYKSSQLMKRLEKAKPLVGEIMSLKNEARVFHDKVISTPKRIVHNDTKLNNILFESKGENVLAVVDLDTTMPGYLAYDFGDMVRSVVSSNYSLSQVLEPMAQAYETGFCGQNTGEMTLLEKSMMNESPR